MNINHALKQQLSKKGEVYVVIKARPGSPKTQVRGLMADNSIKIDIAAQPERGRANKELINFLSKEFKVGKERVTIISGAGETKKLVRII